jgi:predicted  nucleic acid-binding Zn-ribbon protein
MDELRALQQEIELVREEIRDNTQSVTNLQREREEQLRTLVEELVPDVEIPTLRRLERRFEYVVSVAMVEDFRAQKIQTLTHQIQRARSRCDPEKYEQSKSLLEIKIATATEESAPLRSHLAELEQIEGVTRLMTSRYGTPEYPHRWWQSDFYRDWRDADAAIEITRVSSWDDLQKTYFELRRAIGESDEAIQQLHEELAKLNADAEALRDLQTALDTLPHHVMEWVRVKILAALEGDESNTPIATLNARMEPYRHRGAELQEVLRDLLRRERQMSSALSASQKNASQPMHHQGVSLPQQVTYLHTQHSSTYETNTVYVPQPSYVADVDRGMQS